MALKIDDRGNDNIVRIDTDAFEDGAELVVRGSGNVVEIGPDVDLRQPRIHIEGDGNLVRMATEAADVADPADEITRPFLLHDSGRRPQIAILGDANTIETGRFTEIYDSKIQVVGTRNTARLGHRVRVHMSLDFHTDGAEFAVGSHSTCVAMQAALHESRSLLIGEDCQFAADIYLTVSDTHSIVDLATGVAVNPGDDVVVGDHVWLGYRTIVLKGARIGRGSVIGTAAVVTDEIPENCVAVGNPARVVRRGVTWTRELQETPKLVAAGRN